VIRGLKAVGLLAAAACLTGQASAPSHRITMRNVAFTPGTLTIHAGDTVVWRNEDIVAHTATSATAGLDVVVAPGAEGSARFAQPGTIRYLCRFHPNMRGEVIVQP